MTRCALLVLSAWAIVGCGNTPRIHRLLIHGSASDPPRIESLAVARNSPPTDVLEPQYVKDRLATDAPKHLVVLFHGVQMEGELPEWVFRWRDAIFKRTALSAPELEFVIFDWSGPSFAGFWRQYILFRDNKRFRPYAVAAGHAAAKMLVDSGRLHRDGAAQRIHFIGHSRGCSVASVTTQILREAGVEIDHLTILDGLDPLGPHCDIERFNDPPLRPGDGTWCDNYYSDGFMYGFLDHTNYFLSGSQRRDAQMNVHIKYLTHTDSHEMYLKSIEEPDRPWGFQWSALGGGFDRGRRESATIETELPRVFVEGSVADLLRTEHRVEFTPQGPGRPTVWSNTTGSFAHYVRPGTCKVTFRDVKTGEPVTAVHEIVRHRFGAGPEDDTRQTVEGESFTVGFGELGVDHVFRVKR